MPPWPVLIRPSTLVECTVIPAATNRLNGATRVNSFLIWGLECMLYLGDVRQYRAHHLADCKLMVVTDGQVHLDHLAQRMGTSVPKGKMAKRK